MSSRKAKSQIRTCTEPVRMQSYGFEKQRLTAPARTLALALQQLAEAQPRSHHHHHLYKQRDQTTSGYEPFFCVWRKQRPNQSSSPTFRKKSKKPKTQKPSSARAQRSETFHLVLVTATPQETKRASVFWPRAKKTWPRILDRLHVLSRACLSEQADIMSSRCLLEQRDPQRKERRARSIFWKIKERLGLVRLLEINTSRRGALTGEDSKNVRDGRDKTRKRLNPG
jgi:hypothetical protein